jgi:hypothetical protein
MKHFLFIASLFICTTSFAQFSKFRSVGFAYVLKNNISVSQDWTKTDVLITLDIEKKRLTIYNQDGDHFDIISVEKSQKIENNSILQFHSLDVNNRLCDFYLMYNPDNTNQWTIEVEYSDTKYLYLMDKIEN